ncbi:hypothetical protein T484DRAFT_1765495, partial [Baffinella frigidus]
ISFLGSKSKEGVSSFSSMSKSVTAGSIKAVTSASHASISAAAAATQAVSSRMSIEPGFEGGGGSPSGSAMGFLSPPKAPHVLSAPVAEHVLTVADFLDPEKPLLQAQACTRICNGLSVKTQLDSLIAVLEESAGFTGGEGCDGPSGDSDWTMSPKGCDGPSGNRYWTMSPKESAGFTGGEGCDGPSGDSDWAMSPKSAGFTGGEGCDGPSGDSDWTMSPKVIGMYSEVKQALGELVIGMYSEVKEASGELVDTELRPLLQWLAQTLAAALTDKGGTGGMVPEHMNPMRLALKTYVFADDMKVVRGPDWKWGRQDGGGDGEVAVGKITILKDNGWAKVLWTNGHEDSYRVGSEGGLFDLQPFDLVINADDEPLPAIVEALEIALKLLRERLPDKAFQHCLGVVWSACVDVLETCLHDDMTGNADYITRADAVLKRLHNYMHAGGEGVPEE